MDRFGHFFEYIAAINSLYIVSEEFIKSLVESIDSDFKGLKKRFNGLKDNQKENVERLSILKEKDSNHTTQIEELIQVGKSIDDNFNDLEKEISEAFTKENLFQKFHYWCLLGFSFSILFLLLNGFNYDFENINNQAALIICILLSYGLSFLFIYEKAATSKLYCSFNRILFSFISPLILFFFFSGKDIFNFIKDIKFFNFISLHTIMIWAAILITVQHFVVYYIRTTFHKREKSREIRKKFFPLEDSTKSFAIRIDQSHKMAGDMKIE